MFRDALAGDVVFVGSLKKPSAVAEFQLVLSLNHNDAGILGVILMGNAIVKCFKNGFRVVFHAFSRQETLVWENLERIVANLVHHLRCGKKERNGKHLPHIVLARQSPHDFANMVKVMHRFRLAEQQYGRPRYLSANRQFSFVQKHLVAPAIHLFLQFRIVFLEALASLGNRLLVQVVNRSTFDDSLRPVHIRHLPANLFIFAHVQCHKAFAPSAIEMTFPSHRNAARRSRNLEHQHPFPVNFQFVDFAKSVVVRGVLRQVLLQFL